MTERFGGAMQRRRGRRRRLQPALGGGGFFQELAQLLYLRDTFGLQPQALSWIPPCDPPVTLDPISVRGTTQLLDGFWASREAIKRYQVPDHAPRLQLVLLPVDGLCRRDGNVLLVGLGDFHRREDYLPWLIEQADQHVAHVNAA